MRRITVPAAALLVLLSASPAMASAGLPKLASLQLGPHQAAIHNDSQSARIGSNTITLEITNVPAGQSVHLTFLGPNGEVLEPALRPLQILTGPADEHSGHDASTSEHDMSSMSGMSGHDMSSMSGHDTAGQGETFNARTTVKFPEGGTWKAVLSIEADHGDTLQAAAPIEVTYGGPNRVFVASSGLIIFGSILYGALNKRRQSGGR